MWPKFSASATARKVAERIFTAEAVTSAALISELAASVTRGLQRLRRRSYAFRPFSAFDTREFSGGLKSKTSATMPPLAEVQDFGHNVSP